MNLQENAQDEPLLSELKRLLRTMSLAGYKFSTVVGNPEGRVELLSSEELNSDIVTLLRQIVANQMLHTPVHSSGLDMLHVTTEENGIRLHRAFSSPKTTLNASEFRAVEVHVRTCLEELQQLLCKRLCKEMIKVVEPKKQTRHPYKFGDAAKPQWWPLGIRHIEPDHQDKKERMALMVHILLRVQVDIEALRMACRSCSEVQGYKRAIIDEIFFIVRAWRLKRPKTLVITDYSALSKTQKDESAVFYPEIHGHTRNISAATGLAKSDDNEDTSDSHIQSDIQSETADSSSIYYTRDMSHRTAVDTTMKTEHESPGNSSSPLSELSESSYINPALSMFDEFSGIASMMGTHDHFDDQDQDHDAEALVGSLALHPPH